MLRRILRKAKKLLAASSPPAEVAEERGSEEVLGKFSKEPLQEQVESLGPWYHKIDLGVGVLTPGKNNQSLVFDLYQSMLPESLKDLTVLDLGANAGGLSVEFARRGANVTAIEIVDRYASQAEFVREHFGLEDRIEIQRRDIYSCLDLDTRFDIVCYVGLSYHLRYPQLTLDLLSRLCGRMLLASSQTIAGEELAMRNRAWNLEDRPTEVLYGWEPTETLFASMIAQAGFQDVRLVSTQPHPGEQPPRNICGNRSYFIADAAQAPVELPFVDSSFIGKPELTHHKIDPSRV